MIKIISLGKIKENYLIEMINDYQKRINKYHKCEIIELKDLNNLELEKELILKHIGNNDYVVVLDINGKEYSSTELANFLDKTFITHSTITFVIGSSEGVAEEIKNRANLLLSFSKFTFPHGLFRAILLEQIYRAFKINNNETYHK